MSSDEVSAISETTERRLVMVERSTALVTGANKGIGFEIARELGRRGLHVWLGSRDPGRGARAAAELADEGLVVEALQLDVTDDGSVLAAAAALAERTDRLDALVNNAGISTGSVRPTEDTIANVRTTYDTNVFGAIRVIHAVLPLLRASASPRIVMISSSLGSLAWASDFGAPMADVNLLGYNTSKAALNAVTLAFAKELGPSGFKINAGCPGYTATDLNGHQGSRTVEQGAAIGVRLATLPDDGPNGCFFNDDGLVAW